MHAARVHARPNGARVERHPRVGIAHEVGDTPSGRGGEAVSLQRGFDGARAGEPEVGSTRAPFVGAKRRRTFPFSGAPLAVRPLQRRVRAHVIEGACHLD